MSKEGEESVRVGQRCVCGRMVLKGETSSLRRGFGKNALVDAVRELD